MKSDIERFFDCANCCGYCIDSGRAELVDEIAPDMRKLYKKILEDDQTGVASLEKLMAQNNPHWVRYYSAVVLNDKRRDKAKLTLQELLSIDGMVALSSKVSLSSFEKEA